MLMSALPDTIGITIQIINRNIAIVGGVTGRTMRHKPVGELVAKISKAHPGGVTAAAEAGDMK